VARSRLISRHDLRPGRDDHGRGARLLRGQLPLGMIGFRGHRMKVAHGVRSGLTSDAESEGPSVGCSSLLAVRSRPLEPCPKSVQLMRVQPGAFGFVATESGLYTIGQQRQIVEIIEHGSPRLLENRSPGEGKNKFLGAGLVQWKSRDGESRTRAANLLSVREVAKCLGVCAATVYRLCERKAIRHFRVLNAIRIAEEDLLGLARNSGATNKLSGSPVEESRQVSRALRRRNRALPRGPKGSGNDQ